MSRRHAFRPACPDLLEGRIAPSLTAPHVQVQHAPTPAAHKPAKPSHTSTMQSAINSVKSVNWHKVGTQVTDFLGFTHKAKPHPKPAKAHAPAHTLTR